MRNRPVDKLKSQLDEIQSNMPNFELENESVSSANIGWHIEHSLLVIHSVLDALNDSDPKLFRRKFNLKKQIIYSLGKFPRGKARAPKSVRPSENLDHNEILAHLEKVKRALPLLTTLENGAVFKHPIFGNLQLNDSIRFLELHTEHHLRIVREIVDTNRRPTKTVH